MLQYLDQIASHMPEWQEIYTVKSHWPFGYDIMFEDSILVWMLSETEAKRIAGMLNGAYNLGRMSCISPNS